MSTFLPGPSLAAATGTRLDSAAKHIQQCRVSQDHMQELVTFDANCDADELIRNKYRYCVHKDELVLGLGRCWGIAKRLQNTAYPRVISNLGRLAETDSTGKQYNEAIKMIIYMYHCATSLTDKKDILDFFKNGVTNNPQSKVQDTQNNYFKVDPETNQFETHKWIDLIYDLVPVGYANTLGYAHAHNGDTMTSVHIGGLRTVQNGHFEIVCGDIIQWYWPFEKNCFDETGERLDIPYRQIGNQKILLNSDPVAGRIWEDRGDALQRKQFFERQYGQKKGVEKCVPMIKPYKPDGENIRLYDWYRVFAVAIASARPFEAVDIRISRQAL